ncbi:MAG: substrate-binding domain-containing protein [Actinobacteria bacterium]|nr:substrate-binding domain-containing protein [Actinomycetota bacterium]
MILALSIALTSGCGVNSAQNGTSKRSDMIFATTTSVQDSGILDEFIERFESEYPFTVKAVAVGSGAALFMGQNGDACVLMTHEPKAEKQFMEDGYGESIDKVMHNDFMIIGPPEDPAGIKDLEDPVEAVKKIRESGSTFVSRGDASGTHAMELSLWERAGIQPGGDRYIEAGQGMGPTIRIAEEKNAYTLTDRATFIVLENALDLEIMVEGDPSLKNQYSVIVVNHEKYPDINHEGALAFREFLLSKETKALIKDFGRDEYQKRLFYPD